MKVKRLPIKQGFNQAKKHKGLLIDVREPVEYEEGHLEGSINIPLGKLSLFLETLNDLNTPLYLYCRSGARSHEASLQCLQRKFTHVFNIGGIIEIRLLPTLVKGEKDER
jgi:phage shock protein E